METCPTCRFIVPEGAAVCPVCHGDPRSVVLAPGDAVVSPRRRRGFGAGRSARSAPRRTRQGPLARVARRVFRGNERLSHNVRLGLVAVLGTASTLLVVVAEREPAAPAPVVDLAPVDAYDWRAFQPEQGALRVELPSEPTPRTITDGMAYELDLGGAQVVVRTATLGEPVTDAVARLREVAAADGLARRAAVQELRVNTHPWGTSLDVELAAGDTVVQRYTLTAGHLYVVEAAMAPPLAADPDSRARRVYARVVASFTPLS